MKTMTHYIPKGAFFAFLFLFIGLSVSYGQFGMGNTLAPLSGNNFPIIFSNDAKGGHHQVLTIADRNAIPGLRRMQGMLCTVLDAGSGTPKTYQLLGGILDTNWVEFSTGGTGISSFGDLTGKPTSIAGYGITDAITIAHPVNGITATNITNWNTAFGWGNHSGMYRSLSWVPAWMDITSNPFVFTSAANNQLIRYNSVSGKWENWTPNYITGYTETDPTFGAWDRSSGISITTSQISDFESTVSGDLETETTNRIAADATIASNLNLETIRAMAVEDLKENVTNKVTSISPLSTNSHYPSAKLMYDQLLLKVNTIPGKVLSSNDYTSAEKSKVASLSGINTGDQDLSHLARLSSPAFTDIPTAPTAEEGTNSMQIATTGFVSTAVNSAIVSAAIPDAGSAIKGKIQLAGDLSGTAAEPVIGPLKIDNGKIADNTITNAKISSIAAIADTKLETISSPGKVLNSATTATEVNDPNTIVERDANGDFSAGTITGNLTGTATNATHALNADNVTTTIPVSKGGTGAITAPEALVNLGLGNIDNTSDVNKPISIAQQAALNSKVNTSAIGVPNGVASLGGDGLIPTAQIPPISFTSVQVLSNEAEMLALSDAIQGSMVVRTDNNKNYVLAALPSSVPGNWVQLVSTGSNIQSVNGKIGTIILNAADLNLGNVENTSDANKVISNSTLAALNLKEDHLNKSTDVNLGNDDVLYPSQNAVKTYVDAKVATGIVNATTINTGVIKLAGDLGGTALIPVVTRVGGSTAANINTATIAANAATSSLTGSTIVKRDGTGNFNAGIITATLNGNATTATTAANATNAITATNVSGVVSLANGGTGATSALSAKSNLGLANVNNTSDLAKPISTLTQSALNQKVNQSLVGMPNGLATLNSEGLVPTNQIPPISFTTVMVLSNEEDMLSLNNPLVGSVVIRTDNNSNYILASLPATDIGNWVKLLTVGAGVQTVNGQTGTVVLTKTDVGLGQVENTADIDKPINTLTQSALDLKESISNKSTNPLLGTDDLLYPTQNAVKTYVDSKYNAGLADATSSVKGKIKLAGDLGGTADLPTVTRVGNSLANSVSNATILTNTATDLNSPNMIVKRDGNGNFSAGIITATTLLGNATSATTAVTATNVTGIVLPANGGTGVSTTSKGFVFAGPVGAAGAPSFRALTISDLPAEVTNYLPLTGGTLTGPLTGTTAALNSLLLTGAATASNFNGLNLSQLGTGFSITGGTNTSKSLIVNNDATVAGTNSGDVILNPAGQSYLTIEGQTLSAGLVNLNNQTTGTLPASGFPAITGDVTSEAGSLVTTIAPNAVTNADLNQVATATIKGRATAGTGNVEDLTAAQVRTLLNVTDATGVWKTTGNTGTTPGTNFIGTTDDKDVVFKRNGVQSGLLNYVLLNTSWGLDALNPATTGYENTASGYKALYSNTTGFRNTASGSQALFANTTGNYNSALGVGALSSNTTSTYNTSSGYQSMYFNTTGSSNTGYGSYSLLYNVAGSNGVAIGYGSQNLVNNTTTPWINTNTSVGFESLKGSATAANNTGNGNSVLGYQAMLNNTSGTANLAVGYTSLFNNTTGNYNTASGHASLYLNTTGNSNTSLGTNSLRNNVTGTGNMALGYYAGFTDSFTNTPGDLTNSTAIGYYAQVTASNSLILGGKGAYAVSVGIGNTAPAASAVLDITSTTKGSLMPRMTTVQKNAIATPATGLIVYDTNLNQLQVYNGTAWGSATASSGWNTTGNAGTTPGTNFIGTTDDKDVVFKRNGVQSGLLNNSLFNTSWGVDALNPATTGIKNVASGYGALSENTSGNHNVATGAYALFSNTTGYSNTATGHLSLFANTTGYYNSALGNGALQNTTTGYQNVALGHGALYSNSTGINNVVTGYSAFAANLTGNNNVVIGALALSSSSSGNNNTALGYDAGNGDGTPNQKSTLDNNATFLGYQASRAIVATTTALTNITAIGYMAKVSQDNSMILGGTGANAVSVGIGNTAPAASAVLDITSTTKGSLMPRMTTVQKNAIATPATGLIVYDTNLNQLQVYNGTSWGSATASTGWNTTGNTGTTPGTNFIGTSDDKDVVFKRNGVQAGLLNSVLNNTSWGVSALNSATTGSNNMAIGVSALAANTSGNNNTATGTAALGSNSTGHSNAATGNGALYSNSTGYNNAATGYHALFSNTSGDNNTAFGNNAGSGDGTANQQSIIDNNATFVGYQASRDIVANTTALTNITAIGYMAKVSQDNSLILGGTGANAVSVGIGNTAPVASAVLDITSTTKGSLMPRMTTVQKNAITSPAIGLIVYDTNLNQLQVYNGTAWGSATASTGWNTTGNTGTTPGTNFIGTTDDKDVVFKRNGVQSGLLNSASSNTSWGVAALNPATAGIFNTAFGSQTLSSNTTGNYNLALGGQALSSNTTGYHNTASGHQSLNYNTIGNSNTAFGSSSLISNVAGSQGVAIGASSQYNVNNTATPWINNNTSVGFESLRGSSTVANNTGLGNTALGYLAMQLNASGNYNVAVGQNSLRNNDSGNGNTAIGYNAGYTDGVTATTDNLTNATAIGYNSQVTASNSLILGGKGANAVSVGIGNTAPAASAVLDITSTTKGSLMPRMTTVQKNAIASPAIGLIVYDTNLNQLQVYNGTAWGSATASTGWNTTGNTGTTPGSNFIGTTDDKDVVFKRNGVQAGLLNNSLNNTSFGVNALKPATTGFKNTALGAEALYQNNSGNNNTAIGYLSLNSNDIGGGNTAIGSNALKSNVIGAGNTAIGHYAGFTDGTISTPNNLNNATAIGYLSQVTTSNSLVLGATGAFQVNVGIGTTAPIYRLDVNGTGRFSGALTVTGDITASGNVTAYSDIRLKKNIFTLQPVSASLRKINAVEFDRKDINLHQLGFIAQNVQQYFPDLVTVSKDSTAMLSVNYQGMTAPLLKGWQEHDAIIVSQQEQIDLLKKEIELLKAAQEELMMFIRSKQ